MVGEPSGPGLRVCAPALSDRSCESQEILDAVNGASDSEVFAGASWIHSAFAAIHPYTVRRPPSLLPAVADFGPTKDGNGRLARLLGSVPLVRAGLPPLLIPAAHRSEYLAACSIVSCLLSL